MRERMSPENFSMVMENIMLQNKYTHRYQLTAADNK